MLSLCLGILLTTVGLFGTLLSDPSWGIAAYMCFVHITPQLLHITALHAPLVISVAVLFIYIFSPKYPNKFAYRPLEFWLQVVIVVGLLIGALSAFDRESALSGTVTFAKYVLFFLLLVNIIDSEKKLEWSFNALYLSTAWMVYKCWDLRGTMSGRFEYVHGGIVSDSNQFAAALVLLLPLVVIKIIANDKWWIRMGAGLGAFGMVMSIIITNSRAGFLGLLCEIATFIILFKKHRKKIFLTVIILFLAAIPYIQPYYIYRVKSVFSSERIESDASSGSRLAQWKLAYRLWRDHLFFGIGSKNFGYYMGALVEGREWGERGHVCHSLWFETLAEGGLSVFIPLIIMLFLFFKRTTKVKKVSYSEDHHRVISALQAGMVGFLISASFISRFFYEPIYWWCGFAAIYDRIVTESAEGVC